MEKLDKVFICHAEEDTEQVSVLVETIEEIMAPPVIVDFFSSVNLRHSSNWVQDLFESLVTSKVIISLFTPNSRNNPWVLFESGFAQALETFPPIWRGDSGQKNERIADAPEKVADASNVGGPGDCAFMCLKYNLDKNELPQPLKDYSKTIFDYSEKDKAHNFLEQLCTYLRRHYLKTAIDAYVDESVTRMKNAYVDPSILGDKVLLDHPPDNGIVFSPSHNLNAQKGFAKGGNFTVKELFEERHKEKIIED